MKRINFYSLSRIDDQLVAILRNGYTDGCWFYHHGRTAWYAICPHTGLSVASTRTRKACVAMAHDISTLTGYNRCKASYAWDRTCKTYDQAVLRARLQEV